MSLKMKKLVDPKAGTLIAALVPDIPRFQDQVQTALDHMQIMIIEHFTKVQLIDRIHALESPDDLVKLSYEIRPLPDDGIAKLSEYVDNHFGKEPDHIKVVLFLEIGKQVVKGAMEYIQESCRQRHQAIARQESLIIKPPKRKIIT